MTPARRRIFLQYILGLQRPPIEAVAKGTRYHYALQKFSELDPPAMAAKRLLSDKKPVNCNLENMP